MGGGDEHWRWRGEQNGDVDVWRGGGVNWVVGRWTTGGVERWAGGGGVNWVVRRWTSGVEVD